MPFLSKAVFEARLADMRRLMEAENLDGLIFTQVDFAFYASNFYVDVEPWERPTAVVVPRHGQPFMVVNELSTNHIRMARERGTLWVDDVTIYAEHSRPTSNGWTTPQWPKLMAELLDAHGLARGTIGTDGHHGSARRRAEDPRRPHAHLHAPAPAGSSPREARRGDCACFASARPSPISAWRS
jgi:Xaa-Pro aminopeptidase